MLDRRIEPWYGAWPPEIHESQIIGFTCTTDKESWPDGPLPNPEKGPHNNLRIESKAFRIAPGDRLYIRSEFEEWKRG